MKKILIVDDMLVSLMMTENMLCGHYTTFSASSGQEAIEIYRREQPDMVLSDLRMPGMSGYELQQTLQKEMQKNIPFMFMTADPDEDSESKGFENGAMDFIRKPFRPDVLLRRVGNILQTVDQIEGLKKHASTDPLTGLLNKVSAEVELQRVCSQGQGALLMIDLDNFKLVNDIYGHAMGDKVLMSFADILRVSVRPDDVVGRLGGDEFIAFCSGMNDEPGIMNKAASINRLLDKSVRELMGDDLTIPIGASIGCVFVLPGGDEFPELAQKADKALYMAKQGGKHGCQIFREDSFEDEDSAATLTNVGKILGERNPANGAMRLPFEEFRTVYRFLRRTMGIFGKPVSILRFSLPNGTDEKTMEAFFSLLCSTLRTADVATKNGGHCLVLLLNTNFPNLAHAADRLRKKWTEMEIEQGMEADFEYEWSVMEP